MGTAGTEDMAVDTAAPALGPTRRFSSATKPSERSSSLAPPAWDICKVELLPHLRLPGKTAACLGALTATLWRAQQQAQQGAFTQQQDAKTSQMMRAVITATAQACCDSGLKREHLGLELAQERLILDARTAQPR